MHHPASLRELTFSGRLAGPARLLATSAAKNAFASHLFGAACQRCRRHWPVNPVADGEQCEIFSTRWRHEGLERGGGCCRSHGTCFHGRICCEDFRLSERFCFFTPTGLSAGFTKVRRGNVAEIVILLNRCRRTGYDSSRRTPHSLSLFCTPVINLFFPAPPPS
ncbi:type VI secretion system baseplate subunit TssF [Salmonella enterica subsp. enterica]|nr:type VI secretion system baseplate subunit TssF [Salmonella enterica subsp. enterica]